MTETDIIRGCIKGNASCQRMLFDMFAGKMMSVCLRYGRNQPEAEDMLQEGFVRVFNNLHQFKFEGSFEGWMRRVMVNNALKVLEKKRINYLEVTGKHEYAVSLEPSVYTGLGEEEIMKMINGLPDGYRIVFNLNVIEGYSHEEIGQMLNIQPSTSRSQLVKARKMLQKQITELQKIAV